MRPFSIVFFLCCFSLASFSQESDESPVFELGVNTSQFIRQFAILNNNEVTSSPYLLQMKLLNAKRSGLRIGVGASISNSESEEGTTKLMESSSDVNLRVGYEKHHPLTESWSVYYGADFIFNLRNDEIKNTFDTGLEIIESTSLSKSSALGGGPILGIQLKLNERMRLYTETGLYANFGTTTEEIYFSDQLFGQDQIDESSFQTLGFFLPTSLFLAVTF